MRLVSFGCSHVFGSEISAPGVLGDQSHNRTNFSSQLAQELGYKYVNAARVNNVNSSIVEDVYEVAVPGDAVIIGWTYSSRNEYLSNGSPLSPNGSFLSPNIYEAISNRGNYKFPSTTDIASLREIRKKNPFYKEIDADLATALTSYYGEVQSHTFNRVYEFLRQYMATSNYLYTMRIPYIQFFFDIEADFLHMLNNRAQMMFYPYVDNKKTDHFLNQDVARLRPAAAAKSKMLKYLDDDPRFLRFSSDYSTLRTAASQKLRRNKDSWTPGRTHFDQAGNDACYQILRDYKDHLE